MKKIVFLVLVQIFVLQNLFSQYYLYVSTSDENLKPNLIKDGKSNDETLNQIFKDFGIKNYRQSFPGAKTIELQNFYEIHLVDNFDSLRNYANRFDSLEDLLKNKKIFDKIYRSAYCEPTTCNNPVSINDTWIANNWTNNDALNLLNAQCAWTITTGDPNIIVGVIDSEFDENHEDLINTFASIVGTRFPYMLDHGTSVSSCVATGTNNNKGIAGVGYNTRVKGYHANSIELWSKIWEAYLDGIKIINVSWQRNDGGTPAQVLSVQEMVDNGVVLIFAAGNQPAFEGGHQNYADIPGVIIVSGVDANNTHGGTSNVLIGAPTQVHNLWVDVCALSMNVAVCLPRNRYGTAGGTSFASPQVAGVVALLRSINNDLTPAEIEDIIKATTVPIADAHLYPGLLGTGRVNAYNAVLSVCTTTNFTNKTVNTNQTIKDCKINVQDVKVKNNAKLKLEATSEVTIDDDFEVEDGAELEIK